MGPFCLAVVAGAAVVSIEETDKSISQSMAPAPNFVLGHSLGSTKPSGFSDWSPLPVLP